MAEKNSISVSLGITKNLGNFESFRLDASATVVDVDPKDQKSWDELWQKVDDEVSKKVAEIDSGS
jgi:hypothetical protein